MKRRLTLLLLLGLTCLVTPSWAAVIVTPTAATSSVVTAEDIMGMDRSAVEIVIGRRLKFTERLVFNTTKRKLVRQLNGADQETSTQGNGMAIAGFVCGVVGLLFVGAVVLGPLAIVFSAIGLSKSNKEGRPLKGLAIAGLVCGILGTTAILIYLATL